MSAGEEGMGNSEGGAIVLAKHPGGRPRVDEVSKRRSLIMQIRDDLKRRNIFPDNYRVCKELERYGYYVTISEVYHDMVAINQISNYVLNLAQYNYNGLVEEMLDRMSMIMRGLDDIIEKKWTNSKVIYTEEEAPAGDGAGPGMVTKKQKVITDEIADPKLRAYAIQKDLIKIYTDIFRGGIIDTSIAIWHESSGVQKKAFDDVVIKLEKIKRELEDKNALIEKLQSGV